MGNDSRHMPSKGTEGDARPELRELIHSLDSGIVNGRYSHTLDSAVQSVKSSEERRHAYMIMMVREQEIRAQGREEGRVEGREEGRREQGLSYFQASTGHEHARSTGSRPGLWRGRGGIHLRTDRA